MIHEFAIDPVAMNNWQNFRYLNDNFGVEHGRLISRFPKKWTKMVCNACNDNYDCGKISTIDRKRIVERLKNIKHKLVRLKRRYNSEKEWLENAEEQHSISEFRAIISINNPNGQPYILNAYDIDETNYLWNVPREKVVRRKANELAACAMMLLMASKEIIFIDPHFNPTKSRFTETFSHLIDFAFENKRPQRLELHVEHTDRSASFEVWENNCQNKLPQIVPKGYILKVMRWTERNEGDKQHPRYVLTEIGGIRYDYGLDEWDGEGEGKTTDVSLLAQNVYKLRWNDYQNDTTTFEWVDEVVIKGKKAPVV
jgi:hypothetical protein